MVFEVRNSEAMHEAGQRLGALLQEGDAVALEGPLGAGKTTLVQGIAAGLGVTGEIASPTFALMNVYQGRVAVYHLDMYRLDDPGRLALLGYDDDLAGAGVSLVEWTDKHWPFWTEDVLRLRIGIHGEGRRIEATALGPRSGDILQRWLL